MPALTLANALTLLRMLLAPIFVILVVYHYLGWALITFCSECITDLFDGALARWSGTRTNVGVWLDPMADKLLLLTVFVVLTLPGLDLANPLPLWLTVVVISRDVIIVLTVAVVNLASGPRTFTPSKAGKAATLIYFFTGIVVFLAIIFVITPPNVSTPNDNGVTSSNKISLISPVIIPA